MGRVRLVLGPLLLLADMSVLLGPVLLVRGGRRLGGRELDGPAGVGPELRGAGQGPQANRHQRHEQQAGAARVQRRRARAAAGLLRLVQLR